jgi:hypothetical protein
VADPKMLQYGFVIFKYSKLEIMGSNLAKLLASNIQGFGKKPLVLNPGNQTQYIVLNGDAVNL